MKTITIKNRRAYPAALRKAAVKTAVSRNKAAAKTGKPVSVTRAISKVAAEFNIHKGTLSKWVRATGQSNPQPVQLARYQAAQKIAKLFNQPQVLEDGSISYQGKIFRCNKLGCG